MINPAHMLLAASIKVLNGGICTLLQVARRNHNHTHEQLLHYNCLESSKKIYI